MFNLIHHNLFLTTEAPIVMPAAYIETSVKISVTVESSDVRGIDDLGIRAAGMIARALNLPRSNVYAALRRLQDAGLADFGMAERMYYGESKTDADLEYLAVGWGVQGKSEARKLVHRSEREIRVNWKLLREREKWNR
jgi:DNA-binding transcriptional ArsR family regulator